MEHFAVCSNESVCCHISVFCLEHTFARN